MSKNVLSFQQKVQVSKLLDELVEVVDSDKRLCRYRSRSHNDAYVAKQFDFTCTVPNVSWLRKELYGNLVVERTSDGNSRLSELEQKVEFIFNQLGLRWNSPTRPST